MPRVGSHCDHPAIQTLNLTPADAQSEPSGEIVDAYSGAEWPARLYRSLQLFRFHTFTSLSQPHDTISGCLADGEKRTWLTQSE